MHDIESQQQLDNERFLRDNSEFRNFPIRVQTLILKSPNASDDFMNFFVHGGKIVEDQAEPLAVYRRQPSREIIINRDLLMLTKTPQGDFAAERLFSILAHEIGHDKDHNMIFPSHGTMEEYVQFCSEIEARAIFNTFPIFADLRESEPSLTPKWDAVGYDSLGAHWGALYKQWKDGAVDNEGVILEAAKVVQSFPYTRDDETGNQFRTWRDYYLDQFQHLKKEEPVPTAFLPEPDLFDRVFEALINKDDDALRALGNEYFQSPDGQQLMQEGRELGHAMERKADALALAQGRPLPIGYSIGTLTGKQDPRDWDHPDHALYSAIRRELPHEVSDDMAAHVMLQARQAGIHNADRLEHVSVHNGQAFVAGRSFAGMTHVDLSQTPPPMEDTVQQSQRLDQQLAMERQQWLAQQQEQARNGPSMSM